MKEEAISATETESNTLGEALDGWPAENRLEPGMSVVVQRDERDDVLAQVCATEDAPE